MASYSCYYKQQRSFNKYYEKNTDVFAYQLFTKYSSNEKVIQQLFEGNRWKENFRKQEAVLAANQKAVKRDRLMFEYDRAKSLLQIQKNSK